jgi:dTDP-4-amino-4,6-dideoxygalactose transaminase
VVTPFRKPGERHIFNQYVIRASRRDELRRHLEAHGVGAEVYYPLPLHEQRCFAYLEHAPDDFPEAHRAAAEVLALPIYPELTPEQREYVVLRIADFFA